MGSGVFENDLLTGHEPEEAEGRLRLRLRVRLRGERRFRESGLFEIDLLTDHEPEIPGGETPPYTAGGTPAATDARFRERNSR